MSDQPKLYRRCAVCRKLVWPHGSTTRVFCQRHFAPRGRSIRWAKNLIKKCGLAPRCANA